MYEQSPDDLVFTPPRNGQPAVRSWAPRVVMIAWKLMLEHAQSEQAEEWHILNNRTISDRYTNERPSQPRSDPAASEQAKLGLGGMYFPKIGPWDMKVIIPQRLGKENPETYVTPLELGGPGYYYDIWGNIEFGYVAARSDFGNEDVHEGAGKAQYLTEMKDVFTKGWPQKKSSAEGMAAYDDVRDATCIDIGYRLWAQFGLAVKPSDIIEAVVGTPGLEGIPK